jgi:hypothetical protein
MDVSCPQCRREAREKISHGVSFSIDWLSWIGSDPKQKNLAVSQGGRLVGLEASKKNKLVIDWPGRVATTVTQASAHC